MDETTEIIAFASRQKVILHISLLVAEVPPRNIDQDYRTKSNSGPTRRSVLRLVTIACSNCKVDNSGEMHYIRGTHIQGLQMFKNSIGTLRPRCLSRRLRAMTAITAAFVLLGTAAHCAAAVPTVTPAARTVQDRTAIDKVRAMAEQGDAPAQTVLGLMHYGGIGVLRDEAQGTAWIAKAAAQGEDVAQNLLGDAAYAVFSGCTASAKGKCTIALTFKVYFPDGTLHSMSSQGYPLKNATPPTGPTLSYSIAIAIAADHPVGDYLLQAFVTDVNSNARLELQRPFTVSK